MLIAIAAVILVTVGLGAVYARKSARDDDDGSQRAARRRARLRAKR